MLRKAWIPVTLALIAVVVFPASPAAQESDGGAVVLILDASGSMNRTDDAGVVLIDGAKQALTRLVSGLPEGSPVGLLVYGHRVPNTDRDNGCRDTELIVPVGPLDRVTMTDAIASVGAKGFTPIGRSLGEAAAALPEGQGTIILVSDGEDTCAPPDPCEVAASLAEEGIDVRVHTVGFFLGEDDPARAQLQCIADTTGGGYSDVDDIETLGTELGILVHEALPEGPGRFLLPLNGAVSIEAAPVIPMRPTTEGPAGVGGNIIGLISPGETRWYAFDVVGSTGLVVGANIEGLVPGAAPGDYARIVVVDEDLQEYQTGSSRFGRAEIELVTVDQPGPAANLGTTAAFSGFDVPWEPEQASFLELLGYDEDSYEAAVVEALTRPAPPALTDGRFFIGIEWDAPERDVEQAFDMHVSLWEHADVKHLAYDAVDGSLESADAPELVPPDAGAAWLRPPDEVSRRGGYLGSINAGETRWYGMTPSADSAVTVRAFLNRPEGAPDEGEFAVELHDAVGAPVGMPRDGYSQQASLSDPEAMDGFAPPAWFAPRPLVGVEGEGREGVQFVSFTWDGPAGETGQLEFVVDVHGDLGSAGGPMVFLVGSPDWQAAPLVDIPPCTGDPPRPEHCVAVTAPIRPGETVWYRVEVDDWMAVLATATLHRPEGTPLGTTDLFRIEILQSEGTDVTGQAGPRSEADLNDPDSYTHPEEGFLSDPTVWAVNVCPDCDPPGFGEPGPYFVGVTWDSDGDLDEAELHLILELSEDTAMPEAAAAAEEASGDPPAEDEPAEAAAGEGGGEDGGGSPVVPLLIGVGVLVLVAAGIVLLWRRSRRAAGS